MMISIGRLKAIHTKQKVSWSSNPCRSQDIPTPSEYVIVQAIIRLDGPQKVAANGRALKEPSKA